MRHQGVKKLKRVLRMKYRRDRLFIIYVTCYIYNRLDDESRCLRDFRSPRKQDVPSEQREGVFGFQGDLNPVT